MKAKKSLGQNFLKSTLALKKIVEAGEISSDDIILEIGPGKGVLTEKILEKGCCVIAVEKDRELFEFLQNKFEREIKDKKLFLIKDDILDMDIKKMEFKFFSGPRIPRSLSQPDHSKNLIPFSFKIIANIPYNITGAILKKFLTKEHQPEMMILMVQNEVAKRIVARDGKESILSISVKAYGEPKIIMKVPARYFSPTPKVDSAVIAIKNISRALFVQSSTLNKSAEFEKLFWEIIRTGFAHKRKKLSSNLKNYGGNASVGALGNKRAEELKLVDWINLVKTIDINKKSSICF